MTTNKTIDGANMTDNRFSRFDQELIDKYFNEKGKQAIERLMLQERLDAYADCTSKGGLGAELRGYAESRVKLLRVKLLKAQLKQREG